MNINISPVPKFVLVRGSRGLADLFLITGIAILVIGGLLYYSWQRGLIRIIPPIKTTSPPTLSPIRPCNSSDLQAEPVIWDGAGGSLVGFASLTNISSTPCQLEGYPEIQLRSPQGKIVEFNLGHYSEEYKQPKSIHLNPNQQVRLELTQRNNCLKEPDSYSILFFLPDDPNSILTETTSHGARCDNPDGSIVISVGPFYNEVSPTPFPRRTCPESWEEYIPPTLPYGPQPAKKEYITIGDGNKYPPEWFDLEWIKANCQVNVPQIIK